MGKNFSICLGIIFIFTFGYSLQYIESSSGLQPPVWEGGRTELEFADINNDGNLDILSIGDHGCPNINATEHGVMVWFGNGHGSWTNYMNGNFGYGGIAIGDVNNDGYLDIGYGMHHDYSSNDFGDQLMEVALGDGTGRNWTPWDDSLGMNGQTWGMFGTDFADIDNDGDLDIGSVSFGSGDGIHIYQNLMNGAWHQSFGFIGGNSGCEFQFGDINKDGNQDFVATHQNSSVYFGDGHGNFTTAMHNLPALGAYENYRSVALTDVDNDGGLDFGFLTPAGILKVYLFDELGDTWQNVTGNLPTSIYQRVNLWDVNGDGFSDVVAQGSGTIRIWLGNGQGVWSDSCSFTTTSPGTGQAMTARGDIDNNGYADIAMVCDEGSYPSDHNVMHVFKETSVPLSLSVTPIFPKGGEKFIAGSVNFIKWISKVPNNETAHVSIEFAGAGASGPWITLFNNLPNNGTKQWTIPMVNSNNCYLRIKVFTGTDSALAIYHSPFTIVNPSYVNDEPNKIINKPLVCLIQNNNIRTPVLLTKPDNIKINIYSIDGRTVYSDNIRLNAGEQFLTIKRPVLFDGIYFLNLDASDFHQSVKIVKIK
jgi:hypothetical protein